MFCPKLPSIFRGLVLLGFLRLFTCIAAEPKTERQYLSGHGPKDAVPWEFSVTGGRRAGEQTTIPVPSQWEQHGFGTYYYGQELGPRSSEHGLYRLHFTVPDAWRGQRVRLVFEGVMTDATVKVNGKSAGPTHQGAFFRFNYDVASLVKYDADLDNLLEVDVAKVSANPDTEGAERGGDYWVFGGIFRPVWLEAAPMQSIDQVSIDARADGTFAADVMLAGARFVTALDAQIIDADGKPAGASFSLAVPAGGAGRLRITTKLDSPKLWTAETPNLYSVKLTLRKGDEAVHMVTKRFGFRTFEVRAGRGLFLNGTRILLKGVNRHSFRPESGRTLDPEDCYVDVRMIRSMNMNAVRMSHYPPDEAFLDACDELGLYVLDELSGWHHAHDTNNGRELVRAMVERDVNHPSILFWDNGNEGGFNRDLDGEYALHDPQHRRVLHPWELHDDVDTKHYPIYDELVKRLQGPDVVMPTEFIHALYDGGAGAGLEDYWKAIVTSPIGGGGFIWDYADEGIKRTDQNGRIDVFSTFAPDGIVGPHLEREGSYYAVRDIWSPVQIAAPTLDGKFDALTVTNRYDFTSLDQCRFTWKLLRYPPAAEKKNSPTVIGEGTAVSPRIAPGQSGKLALTLSPIWPNADALSVTAFGPDQQSLWTWTWPVSPANRRESATLTASSPARAETVSGEIQLSNGEVTASFDPATGFLKSVRRGGKTFALTDGPRLAFARPETAGAVEWLSFASEDAATQVHRLAAPHLANTVQVDLDFQRTIMWAGFKLEISADGNAWKTIYDGTRRNQDGKSFNFPPQTVLAVRLSNIRRSDGQPIAVKAVRLGYAAARFPADANEPGKIKTGKSGGAADASAWLESRDVGGLQQFRWTLQTDGSLKLDYEYALEGEFLYHGVTFTHPEEKMTALRWLGAGPYRVWQNRLRGTWLGLHEIARHDIQPGDAWGYPEFQGCFGGIRWAQLETDAGSITATGISPDAFLRVGTPRINHQNTTVDFPAGDLSFLHAIPAIGSKFIVPEKTGPASQPAKATGTYRGSVVFRFGD